MSETQLRQLADPFPAALIKKNPKGNIYVMHSVVNQRALSIVGPHSFSVTELVRSDLPEFKASTGTVYPARNNVVVGVLADLTALIDDELVNITEAGDVDNAVMRGDGENLKMAASDAYKRCWMRLGLGLHLWSGDTYFLDAQLDKVPEDEAKKNVETMLDGKEEDSDGASEVDDG